MISVGELVQFEGTWPAIVVAVVPDADEQPLARVHLNVFTTSGVRAALAVPYSVGGAPSTWRTHPEPVEQPALEPHVDER